VGTNKKVIDPIIFFIFSLLFFSPLLMAEEKVSPWNLQVNLKEESLLRREVFHYDAKERRDPFQPLGKKGAFGIKERELDISDLRLIGVIWGPGGNLALVKDSENRGYILRAGDRVAGGRVTLVNRDSVVFEISAYGAMVNVTLKLTGKPEEMP